MIVETVARKWAGHPCLEGVTVRLRNWLSALVAAAILGSPAWAAESKPAVYTFGTLKAPTVEAARAQAQAWLEKVGKLDQKAFDAIWSQESGWNVHAANPTSSAYGIPQALPGSKMSSAGPDWQNNPVTQIKWGLGYIRGRYGSACSAAGFKSSHGWY